MIGPRRAASDGACEPRGRRRAGGRRARRTSTTAPARSARRGSRSAPGRARCRSARERSTPVTIKPNSTAPDDRRQERADDAAPEAVGHEHREVPDGDAHHTQTSMLIVAPPVLLSRPLPLRLGLRLRLRRCDVARDSASPAARAVAGRRAAGGAAGARSRLGRGRLACRRLQAARRGSGGAAVVAAARSARRRRRCGGGGAGSGPPGARAPGARASCAAGARRRAAPRRPRLGRERSGRERRHEAAVLLHDHARGGACRPPRAPSTASAPARR